MHGPGSGHRSAPSTRAQAEPGLVAAPEVAAEGSGPGLGLNLDHNLGPRPGPYVDKIRPSLGLQIMLTAWGRGPVASGADDLVDEGRGLGGSVAPAEGGLQALVRRAGGLLVAGQDAGDGLPGLDPVAELGRQLHGHGRVDVVVLALPAGAQGGRDP